MRAQRSIPNLHPSVSLHIGKLVLHGFESGDRYRIGEAMQRELARLIAMEGVPPLLARGGEIARLDGGAFKVAPGARADAIGSQIAHAVYGGLIR
ncbi:MAG TPA: hypothetical protein VKP13_08490 [Nitrospira sp.]|nr:hypothetical protein [Nitrospira sp.]